MRFPIQLFPTVPRFDFIGHRRVGFALTAIFLALTAYFLVTKGLNFGIDFTGGVVMEVRTQNPADVGKMRALLDQPGTDNASLQAIGESTDVMIRLKPENDQNQNVVAENVKRILNEGYGEEITYLRVDYVGPQVGEELIRGSAYALLAALGGMMLYLWFRFEWQFGVGGILALLHDTILTVGFYAVTQIEFNLTSIAAILTIVGYSINDSVVIYDRVRENLRKFKVRPLKDVLNLSINETLARTFLTGGTVIAALVGLIGFGGEVLFGFSAAMTFGVLIGTFSSIYISATLLIYMDLRGENASQPVKA